MDTTRTVLIIFIGVMVLTAIVYVSAFNYRTMDNTTKAVRELQEQDAKNKEKLMRIAGDINYNDNAVQNYQEKLVKYIQQKENELIGQIELRQQELQKAVKDEMSDAKVDNMKAGLLKVLVDKESALIKKLVETEIDSMSKVEVKDQMMYSYMDRQLSNMDVTLRTAFRNQSNLIRDAMKADKDTLVAMIDQLQTSNTNNLNNQIKVDGRVSENENRMAVLGNDLKRLTTTCADAQKNMAVDPNVLIAKQLASVFSADANKNIGIGTNNPQAKLDVHSSDGRTLVRINGNPGSLEIGSGASYCSISKGAGNVLNTNCPVRYVGPKRDEVMIPIGTIVMWSQRDIPDGWRLCDGSSHARSDGKGTIVTPDLRSRFPLASSDTNPGAQRPGTGLTHRTVNQTGGEETVRLGITHMPSHNHPIAVDQGGHHTHSVTSTQGGNHSHTFKDAYFAESGGDRSQGGPMFGSPVGSDQDNFPYWVDKDTSASSIGHHTHNVQHAGTHTHTITVGNAGGNAQGVADAHNNMPPFYVLHFIMKI